MEGPPTTRYSGGTERNDVSSSNATSPGKAQLDASNDTFTVSALLLPCANKHDAGPFAHIFAVYRGHMHAAALTHTVDTMVVEVEPSAPMIRTNTTPSSPSAMIRRHGEPGTGTWNTLVVLYGGSLCTWIEWAAAKWVMSAVGGAAKSQPGSVQAQGACGHAILWSWT